MDGYKLVPLSAEGSVTALWPILCLDFLDMVLVSHVKFDDSLFNKELELVGIGLVLLLLTHLWDTSGHNC